MRIIILILITAIVIWKNIYTIILIKKYSKERNKIHTWINCIFLIDYVLYYYFLYIAANGRISLFIEDNLFLIILFVILTCANLYYDLKNSKIK